MQERVAGPFAHEPNLVQGRGPEGELILLGTLNRHAPDAPLVNCSSHPPHHRRGRLPPPPPPPPPVKGAQGTTAVDPMPPPKDTYRWIARRPEDMASAAPVMVGERSPLHALQHY
jgi:hypothetical protein